MPSAAPAKPLRVGVVGVGYLGRFHARIYADMPEVQLVGVADINPQRAHEIAEQHHCQAYTDARELLGRADAVSIVVPTIHHVEVARPFLERGVHMLIEKPIAPTTAAAKALVELADRANVVFQVGHLERFNAGIMELAARVQQPRFLEVHRLGEFVDRATDVDVVTDLMIHDIDIVMSLVQSGIRNIAADGIPVITDQVDIANARIEFENGAVANVTASRVSNKKLRRIRIFGREQYYGLDYIGQKIEIVRAVPDASGGKWPKIVTEILDVTPYPPLDTEIAHFIHCVRTGERPLVNGHVGLEALRVAQLVKEKIAG